MAQADVTEGTQREASILVDFGKDERAMSDVNITVNKALTERLARLETLEKETTERIAHFQREVSRYQERLDAIRMDKLAVNRALAEFPVN